MNWLFVGSLLAGSGVAVGAFGAHGLRSALSVEMLEVYETGVRYQMYHGLALLALAWAANRSDSRWFRAAGWLFVSGTLIFSGTLYALAISGIGWLGAITPLGGLCLISGWVCLAVGSARRSWGST